MVSSPLGSQKRVEFMQKLSHYKQVDSAGRILNNVGALISIIYTGPINENNNIKFDASMLSSGIYVVHYYDHDSSIKLPFTISH